MKYVLTEEEYKELGSKVTTVAEFDSKKVADALEKIFDDLSRYDRHYGHGSPLITLRRIIMELRHV